MINEVESDRFLPEQLCISSVNLNASPSVKMISMPDWIKAVSSGFRKIIFKTT